jgi:arylsulfatase A-like enzyme
MRTALVSAALLLSASAASAAKPSFVVMVTDDQRWDCLGCTGHPLLKTPNIDKLAADGTTFRNAFVTTSICCISRASIMSGRLARNHKVSTFQTPYPADVLDATFPVLLKKAGYRVGVFGKWGVGGPPPKELFDVWDAWGDQGPFFHEVDGEKVHNSEYLARRATKFIRETPAEQPFCLIVLYKSPHEPYLCDPRDAALFKDDTITPPKTAAPEHFEALPPFLKTSLNRVRAVRDFPTPEKYQEFVKQYLRCVAGVDRSVGLIDKALADAKRSDNTVSLYTADNGFFLGERGWNHKWLMHEESIRVPLIVRNPLVKERGSKRDEMALNIDIAPTILALAGLTTPKEIDGRDLSPLIDGKKAEWRSHFFYEHHYYVSRDPKNNIPRTEGVRTADAKYITYFDVDLPFEELYDLKADPREERNLAADPKSAAKLAEMKALYRAEVAKLPPAIPGGMPVKAKK